MKYNNLTWPPLVLAIFIPVCVLYYFIRFQLGLDKQVIAAYAGMQGFFFVAVCVSFLGWVLGKRATNSYDKLMLLVTLHVFFLTIITVLRNPGWDSLLYALKDYVFPLTIYWYCRRHFRASDFVLIYKVAAIVLTVVSVIYVAEFIDRVIFGAPPFEYTQKIRDLTMEITGATELSGTVIEGDVFTLIRFEGPLSHNNVTGLGMAIGALLGYVLYTTKRLRFYFFMFSVNIVGLILAAPRTAIFSMLVAFTAYYLLHKKQGAHGRYKTYMILAFTGLLMFLAMLLLDWSAYAQLYNIDILYDTLVVILTKTEVVDMFNSLANPLKWVGVGFPVPGDFSGDYNVIRSDDIFIAQLVSMYGLVGLMIIASFLWVFIKHATRMKMHSFSDEHSVFVLGVVVVIAMLTSTVHTNAMVRPQLFPLFFLALAGMSAYMGYTEKTTR